MTKIFSLLLLVALVKAQVVFPTDKQNNAAPAASENPAEPIDTELFEKLDVNTRQNSPNNFFGSTSCVTDGGQAGTCQSFSSCPEFTSLRRSIHRPSVLSFLRSRICRRFRRTVHLCCVNPNFRPILPPTQPPRPAVRPTSPLQQECGSQPLITRVVGGNRSEEGEWPWLAALGNNLGNDFTTGCAGTLITRRHVLTAGHCFAPGQVIPTTVRLGAYDLTRRSTAIPPQDFTIADRRDGGYNTRTNENDITIVILDREATLNSYVQPACLPFKHRNKNFLGEDLVVTGWGRTRFESVRTSNVPMKALVPVQTTSSCINSYKKLQASRRPTIDQRSLCAGEGITDACSGDSGGPLHYLDLDEEKYYVVGIVSFGVGCARPDFPGVYTRVTSFLDWIERNTQ